MPEEKKCAVCEQIMDLIPAGVSKKTGKPYNAFYACPAKCKQPYTGQQKETSSNQFNGQMYGKQDTKQEAIKAMHEEKQESIEASVAINNAVLLVTSSKAVLEMANSEQVMKDVKYYALALMALRKSIMDGTANIPF